MYDALVSEIQLDVQMVGVTVPPDEPVDEEEDDDDDDDEICNNRRLSINEASGLSIALAHPDMESAHSRLGQWNGLLNGQPSNCKHLPRQIPSSHRL